MIACVVDEPGRNHPQPHKSDLSKEKVKRIDWIATSVEEGHGLVAAYPFGSLPFIGCGTPYSHECGDGYSYFVSHHIRHRYRVG